MAARTVYKMQATKQTLAYNAAEFFWVEALVGQRLVQAGVAVAIDTLPTPTPATVAGVPTRHLLRREALPPPVDEADRLAMQNYLGILGCSP